MKPKKTGTLPEDAGHSRREFLRRERHAGGRERDGQRGLPAAAGDDRPLPRHAREPGGRRGAGPLLHHGARRLPGARAHARGTAHPDRPEPEGCERARSEPAPSRGADGPLRPRSCAGPALVATRQGRAGHELLERGGERGRPTAEEEGRPDGAAERSDQQPLAAGGDRRARDADGPAARVLVADRGRRRRDRLAARLRRGPPRAAAARQGRPHRRLRRRVPGSARGWPRARLRAAPCARAGHEPLRAVRGPPDADRCECRHAPARARLAAGCGGLGPRARDRRQSQAGPARGRRRGGAGPGTLHDGRRRRVDRDQARGADGPRRADDRDEGQDSCRRGRLGQRVRDWRGARDGRAPAQPEPRCLRGRADRRGGHRSCSGRARSPRWLRT